MTTPEEIARIIVGDPRWDNTQGLHGTPIDYDLLASFIAEALADYAEQQRDRIRRAALAIRADYPEDVFPSLPAAAGARLAIDRLLVSL